MRQVAVREREDEVFAGCDMVGGDAVLIVLVIIGSVSSPRGVRDLENVVGLSSCFGRRVAVLFLRDVNGERFMSPLRIM
jgi:hypothetical protein